MVKWVSADGYQSPFSGVLERAASSLWGDTLTPALKREQLLKAQRENAGAKNMMDLFRETGTAAAGRSRAGMGMGMGRRTMAPIPPPSTEPQDIASDAMIALGKAGTNDWLRYENQNATRNQALSPELVSALSFLPDMGLSARVFSGGQPGIDEGGPRVGSTRHDHGDAADMFFYKDGRQLDWSNPQDTPIFQDIVRRGREAGITGFGAGDGYMQPGSMHVGFGPEAVWGAGGSGANAPQWLTDAFGGQYMPPASPSGFDGDPNTTPGQYNPLNGAQFYSELAARAVEAGMDPGNAAELARMFAAGAFGAENQATTDAFVGAGGDYGDTYSGFSANQNRMERDSVRGDLTARRGQDVARDTALTKDENDIVNVVRDGRAIPVRKRDILPTDMTILSDAEQKAQTAAGMDLTDPQKLAYIGAEPKNPPQADSYVSRDGTIYRSVDGMTDAATGEPLPSDAMKTSVVSADRAAAGLDKINARNIEGEVIAGQKFKGTLDRARSVANAAGPTAFGIIGRARSVGQDVQSAIDAAGGSFGTDIKSAVQDTENEIRGLAANGDPVASNFLKFEYDPNLTALEMYARLLPYEAAMAIAGQEGRGLSDNDVKRFQAIVGDPLSFFGSQKAFLTTLDTIEKEVDARLGANRAVLGGGRDAAMPSGAAPETSPQMSGPQPGDIEDGYRFKGGDPADPSNWEPVQ